MLALVVALMLGGERLPEPAQPVEPDIMRLVAEGRTDFRDIRGKHGERSGRTTFYTVTLRLRGFAPCDMQVTDYPEIPATVSCDVPGFPTDDAATHDERYRALVLRLRDIAAAHGKQVEETQRVSEGQLTSVSRYATVSLDAGAVRATYASTIDKESGWARRTVTLWVDAPLKKTTDRAP